MNPQNVGLVRPTFPKTVVIKSLGLFHSVLGLKAWAFACSDTHRDHGCPVCFHTAKNREDTPGTTLQSRPDREFEAE